MIELKDYFDCRENYHAGQRQGKEEVSKGIECLKAKRATALLTVECLARIYQMSQSAEGKVNDGGPNDHVKCIEEEEDTVGFFPASERKKFEEYLPCPPYSIEEPWMTTELKPNFNF